MGFNFTESNKKYREAEIERDIKYKSLVSGLLKEVTKYKELESRIFPMPYKAEEEHGYIDQKFKRYSTILLNEITILKDFDKFQISELLLQKINLEFHAVSRDTFIVDDGDDTHYSRDFQKEKLGELGAEILQHYFYIKTWLELAKRKKYIPETKVKKFDKFFKNFLKIQEFWEKSVLI